MHREEELGKDYALVPARYFLTCISAAVQMGSN